MEPVTVAATIGTLAGTASKVLDLVKSARDRSAKDPKTRAELDKAQDLILSLRQTILDLQERVLRLQTENSNLEEQLRQHQATKLDRSQYKRTKLGESVVVVPAEDPEVYMCPTCFEAGQKTYLSKLPRAAQDVATHLCPKCKAMFGAS
jgi:predicted nuclease with TOPRIM domain